MGSLERRSPGNTLNTVQIFQENCINYLNQEETTPW